METTITHALVQTLPRAQNGFGVLAKPGGGITQRRNNAPPVSMKALLESGVHFGHRTNKWNPPKMRPYIFTERNGIHIIDLQQTVKLLEEAAEKVTEVVANGGTVLFVGTKRQAQETIQEEAERCGMPYVNQRWLGGTLTNWVTIQERIVELARLEKKCLKPAKPRRSPKRTSSFGTRHQSP